MNQCGSQQAPFRRPLVLPVRTSARKGASRSDREGRPPAGGSLHEHAAIRPEPAGVVFGVIGKCRVDAAVGARSPPGTADFVYRQGCGEKVHGGDRDRQRSGSDKPAAVPNRTHEVERRRRVHKRVPRQEVDGLEQPAVPGSFVTRLAVIASREVCRGDAVGVSGRPLH